MIRPNKDGPRGGPTYNCGLTYTKAKGGVVHISLPTRRDDQKEEIGKRRNDKTDAARPHREGFRTYGVKLLINR